MEDLRILFEKNNDDEFLIGLKEIKNNIELIEKNKDFLVKVLQKTDNRMIKETIVNILKKANFDDVDEKKLEELLMNDDLFVRDSILTILGKSRSLYYLNKLLNSKNKHIRKYALDSLFRMEDPELMDFIAKGLEDEDINNVMAAIEYLGELEGYKYADKISDLIDKFDNPFFISTVLQTLSIIGNNYSLEIIKNKFKQPENLPDMILIPYLNFMAKFNNIDTIEIIEKIIDKKGTILYKEFIDIIKSIIQNTQMDKKTKLRIKEILKELFYSDIPYPNKYEILILVGEFCEDEEVKNFIKKVLNEGFENNYILFGILDVISEKGYIEFKDILKKILSESKDEDVVFAIEDTLKSLEER
ncbi:HEAT repeat domain-containing protein [Marinitoga sp. 1138]|uniref:HEAT repeat domain-containing protein n=1 Tax=Marinitoga sp. 1138 TaxID=1643334 RepID=UPI001586BADB|nr:HEAT repeat domain-containing protein [Marinitoga sp. 1138]NUU96902.1 hypothetical protein [Marinitoga sp. 1138]